MGIPAPEKKPVLNLEQGLELPKDPKHNVNGEEGADPYLLYHVNYI